MRAGLALTFEGVAAVCHEANRAYCQVLGDLSQLPWREAPAWQRESAVDGVRAIAERWVTGPEQSHERWLEAKRREGWTYGPEKDPGRKQHPCIVPYAQLPATQRAKDALFFAVAGAILPPLSATAELAREAESPPRRRLERAERLAQRLDACDKVGLVKITDRRRQEWFKGAAPGDRWAVAIREGGEFFYGPTLADALDLAWAQRMGQAPHLDVAHLDVAQEERAT